MFPILKSRYIMRKILFLTGILFVAGIAGACHDSESASGRPDGIEVGFALRGVGISASVQPQVRPDSRAAAESLSAGSTVRVAAYKRRASGATADIAQDTYVSEAVYEVQEDGSLKPCAVDSEGKVTSSAGDAMRLSAGAYDFYALTPALPFADDHRSVSVEHGTDYACSLTAACQVAPQSGASSQTVALSMLERKCSRLYFTISRKAENVTKAVIKKVELSEITLSPVSAVVCEALPTDVGGGTYDFPASTFAPGGQPYEYTVADEVLPKADAPFGLAMQVVFNSATEATDLDAQVSAMAFAPGLRYTFDVSLQGGFVLLTLQITPWNTDAVWDTSLGDQPHFSVVVGSWEISGWTTDVGGYFTPQIKPDSWTENKDWSADLGAYFSALADSDAWTDVDMGGIVFENASE